MGDDDDAAGGLDDEALEALEAGEVEVVRRLVEQDDLEAGKQDARERHPRRLASREGGGRLPEDLARQTEIVGGHTHPGVEVSGTQAQPVIKCHAVTILCARLTGGKSRRGCFELEIRICDTGSAGERHEHGLVRVPLRLLRQVPDGSAGRRSRHRAGIGDNEPRQDLKSTRQ